MDSVVVQHCKILIYKKIIDEIITCNIFYDKLVF